MTRFSRYCKTAQSPMSNQYSRPPRLEAPALAKEDDPAYTQGDGLFSARTTTP
jgi:hypothetical protein